MLTVVISAKKVCNKRMFTLMDENLRDTVLTYISSVQIQNAAASNADPKSNSFLLLIDPKYCGPRHGQRKEYERRTYCDVSRMHCLGINDDMPSSIQSTLKTPPMRVQLLWFRS